MKKISLIVVMMLAALVVFGACNEKAENETAANTGAEQQADASANTEAEPQDTTAEALPEKVISPLDITIDMNDLNNCTLSVSLEEGGAYLDDTGKMQMNVTVYGYDLYDMVDVAMLEEGDGIVRLGETVVIETLERLDTGLVIINGGEENGGFSLYTNDDTVYYEIGFNDAKAFYALGDATLRVSTEFVYTDKSDLDAEPTVYYPGDFLLEDFEIEYNFTPYNTQIVVSDGQVVELIKNYIP